MAELTSSGSHGFYSLKAFKQTLDKILEKGYNLDKRQHDMREGTQTGN